ncbi:hypothetical protein BB560_001990 [Smittium megazygosporum]|uniref:Chitin-binding type-2 domain-containing protein n=1 Tax=Smittium megazygosporum TaxID=133381 RepID=A0A2T9ZG04_9FUNG|nr:hypothetical protein BB560_001990 [Smittium megazygosporum]
MFLEYFFLLVLLSGTVFSQNLVGNECIMDTTICFAGDGYDRRYNHCNGTHFIESQCGEGTFCYTSRPGTVYCGYHIENSSAQPNNNARQQATVPSESAQQVPREAPLDPITIDVSIPVLDPATEQVSDELPGQAGDQAPEQTAEQAPQQAFAQTPEQTAEQAPQQALAQTPASVDVAANQALPTEAVLSIPQNVSPIRPMTTMQQKIYVQYNANIHTPQPANAQPTGTNPSAPNNQPPSNNVGDLNGQTNPSVPNGGNPSNNGNAPNNNVGDISGSNPSAPNNGGNQPNNNVGDVSGSNPNPPSGSGPSSGNNQMTPENPSAPGNDMNSPENGLQNRPNGELRPTLTRTITKVITTEIRRPKTRRRVRYDYSNERWPTRTRRTRRVEPTDDRGRPHRTTRTRRVEPTDDRGRPHRTTRTRRVEPTDDRGRPRRTRRTRRVEPTRDRGRRTKEIIIRYVTRTAWEIKPFPTDSRGRRPGYNGSRPNRPCLRGDRTCGHNGVGPINDGFGGQFWNTGPDNGDLNNPFPNPDVDNISDGQGPQPDLGNNDSGFPTDSQPDLQGDSPGDGTMNNTMSPNGGLGNSTSPNGDLGNSTLPNGELGNGTLPDSGLGNNAPSNGVGDLAGNNAPPGPTPTFGGINGRGRPDSRIYVSTVTSTQYFFNKYYTVTSPQVVVPRYKGRTVTVYPTQGYYNQWLYY